MSNTTTSHFTIGITYWPRRKAFRWWGAFDRGEVRDELAHVVAIGCDSVRFCLRWEDVQPAPHKTNSATLRALEQTLNVAEDANLKVVLALFPVLLGGALHLPRWVSNPDPFEEIQQLARFGRPLVVQPSAQPAVIYDWSYHPNEAQNPFRDRAVREAQRYQIAELVGYFGDHPAIDAWQIGEGLERIRKPDSADAVQNWYAKGCMAIKSSRSNAQTLGVVSDRALLSRHGPRPEHLVRTCDRVAVALDPAFLLPNRRPLDLDALVFQYALASSLAERPLTAIGLGQATAPDDRNGWVADVQFGRPISSYLATEAEQEEYLGSALERLHAAGARGVWLAGYADYPTDLWRTPPLDLATRERTRGLVTADGREKAVINAIRTFAEQRKPVRNEPQAGLPMVDSEQYWRNPAHECERLWREFIMER